MHHIELCSFCVRAYGYPGAPASSCMICNNTTAIIDELVSRATLHFQKSNVKEISFSTKIPKQWLVKEDLLFDQFLCTASIKSAINSYIARALGARGFSITQDPRCIAIFDLEAGALSYDSGDLFVFGRYYKHVKGISQSRWMCNTCSGKGCSSCNATGSNYISVEEILGLPFKVETGAAEFTLHASGREDVDVTNSAGRAFVLELTKAARLPDLESLSKKIAHDGRVSVSHLAIVPRVFSELVTESHFDKEYVAHISVEGGVNRTDLAKLEPLGNCLVTQRTPLRVAHRRADLDRKRKVLSYALESLSKEGFVIRILTEPGTYIKELISGDEGRTKPSISELLGRKCTCISLEVTAIHDEVFDACLSYLKAKPKPSH